MKMPKNRWQKISEHLEHADTQKASWQCFPDAAATAWMGDKYHIGLIIDYTGNIEMRKKAKELVDTSISSISETEKQMIIALQYPDEFVFDYNKIGCASGTFMLLQHMLRIGQISSIHVACGESIDDIAVAKFTDMQLLNPTPPWDMSMEKKDHVYSIGDRMPLYIAIAGLGLGFYSHYDTSKENEIDGVVYTLPGKTEGGDITWH